MITKTFNSRKSGFTLIEMIVVAVFVFALIAGLIPLIHNRYVVSLDGVARTKGRDIYIAIIGANSEREPLGLPPVWPSDLVFTNKITGYVEDLNFKNSTDYHLESNPVAGDLFV